VSRAVRRRRVRADVRGEWDGDVRESMLGELRVRGRIARDDGGDARRRGRGVRARDAVSGSDVRVRARVRRDVRAGVR
jgi:hypothetical protein